MKIGEFLRQTRDYPVIDTTNLPSVFVKPVALRVQISRWVKAGKLLQLRRSLYVLAEPYRKVEIYEPHVASLLQRPSYLSLEKALEYHDLIPEAVSVYTSVTTKRTAQFRTPLGVYEYVHVKPSLFWGYQSVRVNRQTAFIALPEKALLDLLYFRKAKSLENYIAELRLQNFEKIAPQKLMAFAKKMGKPKMLRAARYVAAWMRQEQRGQRVL